MIKHDKIISSLMHSDIVEQFAKEKNITVTEARAVISKMSFGDYYNLLEAPVIPPSGNMIGPNTAPVQQNKQAATNPQQSKPVWSGQGPLEVGMEVGIKGQNGLPTPTQITKVDQSANGVQVKNPITGKIEWMNTDALQPGIVKAGAPGTPTNTPNGTQPTAETQNLSRLRELAGLPAKVGEDCSAGASGAGGIAVAAKPMGTVQRRQPTDERIKKEYTPNRAKTVVGDTKPAQASGLLSATLAANNKPTASRTNAGFKK